MERVLFLESVTAIFKPGILMISADLPFNEEERLRKLDELDILDTIEEQAYDDLTHLAAQICDAPIALVSLIDESRQWFKSHYGLSATETPREMAFCAHAILQDELFVIEDADQDNRFHDNPLVTGEPQVKFYAGAPLILDSNICVGTLCVIDNHARTFSAVQKESLRALARQVVSQLQLRLQVKALENLDHAKDEFLSMVSHELRTPLTSIKGSLGIMNHKSGALDEQMSSMLDIAVRNTEQLLAIVNDILDLAKMEAGKLEIKFDSVNLVELLPEALKLNTSYIDQCGCEGLLDLPEDYSELIVRGDKQRLIQVISNLLSNAVKFSPAGSRVRLGLNIDGNEARVSVTDYGSGIPVDQQEHLFKKFRQLGSSENLKLPGTGLGLNICKHIIEAHNGHIGFESDPDNLTVFYFTLGLASK